MWGFLKPAPHAPPVTQSQPSAWVPNGGLPFDTGASSVRVPWSGRGAGPVGWGGTAIVPGLTLRLSPGQALALCLQASYVAHECWLCRVALKRAKRERESPGGPALARGVRAPCRITDSLIAPRALICKCRRWSLMACPNAHRQSGHAVCRSLASQYHAAHSAHLSGIS